VATASDDRTARLWDLATGALLVTYKGHAAAVNSVSITPDGRRLVTGSVDKTARVWNLDSGALLREIESQEGHRGPITSLAVNADKDWLVTATNVRNDRAEDQSVRFWDMKTGDARGKVDFGKDNALKVQSVSALKLLPDGKRVAVAQPDGIVRVIELESFQDVAVINDMKGILKGIGVTPNDRLITASTDDTARIWDLKTGQALTVLEGHQAAVNSVAVSRDGKRVFTGSEDRTVRVWDAEPFPRELRELLKIARREAPRCLTQEQRERFYVETVAPPSWCEAEAKWPYDATSFMVRASEAYGKKNYASAIDLYQRVLAFKDSDRGRVLHRIAAAHNEIAWLAFTGGHAKDGLDDAEKAVALAPDNANILDTRGHIYLALDRLDAAFADFNKAISLQVRTPGTYYGRATCWERRGETALAISDYRQALGLQATTDYQKMILSKARERLDALTSAKSQGGGGQKGG
jgi:tetratricopeptide (TPR) repeat protein